MRFVQDFDNFLINEVNLDPGRLSRLQERVDTIEDFVAGHDTLADMLIDMIPAGSWAFRTIIKPVQETDEFDADVLLHMTKQDGWLPKDYLEFVYSALQESGVYREMTELHKRCVRIKYANDFHIDLVPYIEIEGNHFITYRLEPRETGTFELSNPEAFTEWMDERERASNGTFVKVVRLMKYLRDHKETFTCVSVILTTLLGEQLDPIEASYKPELYTDVPTSLMTLISKLADTLPEEMPAVMDPGGTGDDFSDRYKDEWNYKNFRKMIRSYAIKIEEAYKDTDPATSEEKWRDVFGDNFRRGISSLATKPNFNASVPWEGEQFIHSNPFNFWVPQVMPYKARINGRVTGLKIGQWSRRNGFRRYDLAKNGNRVAKNRSITFDVKTTAPPPYNVYWKVRNGDDEAAKANSLRGEITKAAQMVEPTAFTGGHYVECYIVKDGKVVATDRQRVLITLR